jgi:hypothetical protein
MFPLQDVRKTNTSEALLGDFFTVKRGIATGNNGFFILNKEKVQALDLPRALLRPVLPNSRHLLSDEIAADSRGNPILDHELFLLDCKLPEHEVEKQYPKLWDYLLTGKETVSKGYLCKSRKCWYFQEYREAPLFICTYMGRERNGFKSSFRFILNHSDATVTNCYLALYPKGIMREFITERPEQIKTIWDMMNRINAQYFVDEGRVYGGGLRKVEPAELMKVPVPELEALIRRNMNIEFMQYGKMEQTSFLG